MCIRDSSTKVVNRTQVKVLAWYDNEMSYAHRLIELIEKVAEDLNGPVPGNLNRLTYAVI